MHSFLIVAGNQKSQEEKIDKVIGRRKISEEIILDSDVHTIKEIRELLRKLSLQALSFDAIRKVVVKNAHLMTTEAANAFLKTLEEPPAHTLIFLTTPAEDLLLPTIVSRCQTFFLSTDNLDVDLEESRKLLSSSLGERLVLLDKVSKDRKKAQEFLASQELGVRILMLKEARKGNLAEALLLATLIQNIANTRADIKANVNIRLTLTELFLKYPNLNLKKA